MEAWRALDKATIEIDGHRVLANTRVRRDRIDKTGVFTLRHRSKLHHVSVGREHKGERIAFGGKRPEAADAGPDADRFLQASSEAAAPALC